ncbi:hypothetical protein SAMN05444166_8264 [Singulisphaera sp. GP187]|uniref:hypothetical protein n=1 Tax=Singulisphaera sp. GP187 TaxID=1882752 RepID=UPI000929779E|nr:hypothetical protein [Singulisphaera sp. GP187]SIO66898.1 hypothetical protein SAMN05444166_8264 [Singulisphaera sp. GP187]
MGHKVLVLGHDSRSFLSVVRSLGRGGIEVHAAWHRPGDPAARSRYLARRHDLPAYREHDDQWKVDLIALLCREQFDLVIPCHDSCLVPLQQHRTELEPHGRLALLSDESFAVFFDKFQTNELARSVGVRVPRETILSDLHNSEYLISEFTLPVVLKPRESFNPGTPDSRHEVRKVYTRDELDQALEAMIGAGPVAIQENVLGRGVGVELLMRGGRC